MASHSAVQALALVAAPGAAVNIDTGDFLLSEPEPRFDAVVGNPPYVRYQSFSGKERTTAKRAALRAGVSLTNLASSWAAFALHPDPRHGCSVRPSRRRAGHTSRSEKREESTKLTSVECARHGGRCPTSGALTCFSPI